MKTFIAIVVLVLAGSACADVVSSVVISDAHVDCNISFDSVNKFSLGPRDADEGIQYSDSRAVLYGSPATIRTRTGNEIGDFSFLGVNIGEHYWRLPQIQAVGQLFLGVAAYGVSNGELDSYDATVESNGRVTGVGTWSRVRLIGISGPGHFSGWQSGSEGPKVFIASFGGIQTSDCFWSLASGHAHYNWGFSKTGNYDIQFRILGHENDNAATIGQEISSQLFCLHYGIDSYPAIVDGLVNLQNWLGDIETKPISVKLVQSGVLKTQKSQLIMKRSATQTDPTIGRFAFGFSERGQCDIVLKPQGFLSRKIPLTLGETLSAGSVTETFYEITGSAPIDLTFINGDCDDNDVINTDDYLILSDAFDTSVGDGDFDSRADIDGSGTVTTDDYLILSNNFDLSGEA